MLPAWDRDHRDCPTPQCMLLTSTMYGILTCLSNDYWVVPNGGLKWFGKLESAVLAPHMDVILNCLCDDRWDFRYEACMVLDH